jgi:pimeloyl-ACP methyl ester carboxylesterase
MHGQPDCLLQSNDETAGVTEHMRHVTGGRSASGHAGLWTALAAGLALSALLIRSKTKAVEAEYAPSGQFMEIDGVRLHYIVRGQGEPLLLIHGNGSSILDLECSGLLDRAAERYQVIAFDRPGFGFSSRPRGRLWTPDAQARLLHKALRKLGVQRPVVAGHSLGTQVALSLALLYPEDVRSLALLSGYYFPSARVDAVVNAPVALPVIGDLLRYTISPWLARLIWPLMARHLLFGPSEVTSSFRAYPAWMSIRPLNLRAEAAEMLIAVVAASQLSKLYGEVEMPVVIMAGTDDRFVDTERNSVRLHRELSHSDLILTPGAGHMVHHIAPDEVMEAIDAAAAAPGRRDELTATPARAVAERITDVDVLAEPS